MNLNIGCAVILAFYTFHLRGQTKVAYLEICYKQKHPFLTRYISIHDLRKYLNKPKSLCRYLGFYDVKQMWYLYVYTIHILNVYELTIV